VWEVTNRYTFKACEPVASPAPSGHRGALWGLLVALLFCLLLVLLYFMGVRRRAVLLSIVAVAIVAVVVAFLVGRAAPRRLSRTVAGLKPGKAYYWKVIAEDGKAGTVESETRRFAIR
jgi:peptidoglycan/LPS O-acetylase OafA/YrhL